MNYKVIDKETYYRQGVFRHFSEDCKCSSSMTARVDVTDLVEYSKKTGTKFYVNFLYILTKVLNSREDYRMSYLWETDEMICYDTINPTQYIFHEDTETCTPVYTNYSEDYDSFYHDALADIEDLLPIVNWGKYREENGRLVMPLSVRMNHAVADGYLIALVYKLVEDEIKRFIA